MRESEPSGPLLRRTTVLTVSQRVIARADRPAADGERELSSGLAVAGGSIVLPSLRAEERLLLGLVDGRLSVARLARLSGLSEEATIQALRTLCSRRVLVPVETKEVTIRGKSGEALFQLGPYEVSSRIGQGGMGSVYAGRRTGAVGFRRLFAIKVVRQDSGQEQAAERSFIREVQIGSWLDHPNTQSVVDVGTYKNQPYLVLQFVEGTSLEELSFGRRVPPDILVSVLLDVLRGLQSAHELSDDQGNWLGLVHGDVSPPNILVGTDGVARLTDFGSARFTALGETGQADPTNLGKPAYMAPEQLYVEPLDARTDLFAVGVMMWTALTGQALFSADSYEQIIANVLRKEIAPPERARRPGLPRRDLPAGAQSSPRRPLRQRRGDGAGPAQGGVHQRPARPSDGGGSVRSSRALGHRQPPSGDASTSPTRTRRGRRPHVAMPRCPRYRGRPQSQPGLQNLAQTMVIPGRSLRAEPTKEPRALEPVIMGPVGRRCGAPGGAARRSGSCGTRIKAAHQHAHVLPPAADPLPGATNAAWQIEIARRSC